MHEDGIYTHYNFKNNKLQFFLIEKIILDYYQGEKVCDLVTASFG
jgi:hypothetical protein